MAVVNRCVQPLSFDYAASWVRSTRNHYWGRNHQVGPGGQRPSSCSIGKRSIPTSLPGRLLVIASPT